MVAGAVVSVSVDAVVSVVAAAVVGFEIEAGPVATPTAALWSSPLVEIRIDYTFVEKVTLKK